MSNPRKKIEREVWEIRLEHLIIRKKEENDLVLNFLVTEGYAETAKKFQIESCTEWGKDLARITERMAIRKAVHSGDIKDAIAKINDLNPEILHKNPLLYFHLQQQMLIELIRHRKVKEALEFAQEELAPLCKKNKIYFEELERTIVLLAFDNAKDSPYWELMEMSQRVKTEIEVNRALLASQGRLKDPKLTYVLTLLQETQAEVEVEFPRIDDIYKETWT